MLVAQILSPVWMGAFGAFLAGGKTGQRLTTKTYDADAGLHYLGPLKNSFPPVVC